MYEEVTEIADDYFSHYGCALKYTIDGEPLGMPPTSKDCKLEAVTYALKGVSNSIDFVPKEMEL